MTATESTCLASNGRKAQVSSARERLGSENPAAAPFERSSPIAGLAECDLRPSSSQSLSRGRRRSPPLPAWRRATDYKLDGRNADRAMAAENRPQHLSQVGARRYQTCLTSFFVEEARIGVISRLAVKGRTPFPASYSDVRARRSIKRKRPERKFRSADGDELLHQVQAFFWASICAVAQRAS